MLQIHQVLNNNGITVDGGGQGAGDGLERGSLHKTNMHCIKYSLWDQPDAEVRLREYSHNKCHFNHFEIKYKYLLKLLLVKMSHFML